MSDWRIADEKNNPTETGYYLVTQEEYTSHCRDEGGHTFSRFHRGSVQIGHLARRLHNGQSVGVLRWWHAKNVAIERITHWMPLPEGPNE